MITNCQDCSGLVNGDIITISEPQQPFCEQCGDDNSTCVEKIDSKCVIYHSDNVSPSKLTNLGLPNLVSAETIFEKINDLVGNNFNTPLVGQDSPTVDITSSGVSGHTFKADVKVSSQLGNVLQAVSDGLYVSFANDGKVKVNATDPADYLINQLIGGTDGIISTSTVLSAGMVQILPVIDLRCLIDALAADTYFQSVICAIVADCQGRCPTISTINTLTTT